MNVSQLALLVDHLLIWVPDEAVPIELEATIVTL